MKSERPLKVVFFKTDSGNEPVREWLRELPKEDCKSIGTDILTVQYAWPVGKPLVDNLGDGLWEVRSRLNNRIARTLFAVQLMKKLCCCTASSRNNKKRRRPNSTWRKSVKSNIWRIYEQKKTSRRRLPEISSVNKAFWVKSETRALKQAVSLQLNRLLKENELTKTEMAVRMKTSRAVVDRLLDATNSSVTLNTLNKAARALGRKIKIELVPA